jgi:hypothetical protein
LRGGGNRQQQQQQGSLATSPDTSSLISCSEHYNGESLIGNLSPQVRSTMFYPGCESCAVVLKEICRIMAGKRRQRDR